MRVSLVMRKGPMAGQQKDLLPESIASGKLAIGREPGPGGLILAGDATVSRRHGDLFQENGQLVFANLSANGTEVDGKIVMGRQSLKPGAMLKLGSHEIEVLYKLPESKRSSSDSGGGSLLQHGPLAKPAVRILLAAYLLAILALAIFLWARGEDSAIRAYQKARETYSDQYLSSPDIPEAESEARLARADQLALELEAHVRGERWLLAEATCRELMTLDNDTGSPLYQFAARRLGELADKKR